MEAVPSPLTTRSKMLNLMSEKPMIRAMAVVGLILSAAAGNPSGARLSAVQEEANTTVLRNEGG